MQQRPKKLLDEVRIAGISKLVNCHTFRHSFATHLVSLNSVASPATYENN